MQPGASWQISWTDASGIPRRATIPAAGLRIGRAPENDIVLDEPTVSRMHAMVSVRDCPLMVDASASTNGIVVAGRVAKSAVGNLGLSHRPW